MRLPEEKFPPGSEAALEGYSPHLAHLEMCTRACKGWLSLEVCSDSTDLKMNMENRASKAHKPHDSQPPINTDAGRWLR